MPKFEFDRYIDGHLKAEGVTIEQEPDLESAMRRAVQLARRGRGERLVLVLTNPPDVVAECQRQRERANALAEELVLTRQRAEEYLSRLERLEQIH